MWPWEHAALGYVLYSLAGRLYDGDPPGETATVVLAVGTQLPDLVDKTLSWGFDVFPTGYAIGHSTLVAAPVGVAALAWGGRKGRLRVAAAFVAGYWSHILGDLVGPVRRGEPVPWDRVLWPVVERPPYPNDVGIERGVAYLSQYARSLADVDLSALLVVHLGLTVVTIALWVVDGTPGVRAVATAFRRAVAYATGRS